MGCTPQWQLHEEHDYDVKRILTECGCMDKKGRLRRWKGPLVSKMLKEMGHDSIGFGDCICKRFPI